MVGFWVVLLRRRVVLLEVVVEGSLDKVGVHQVIVRVGLPQDTLGLVTSSQGVRLVRGRRVDNLQLDIIYIAAVSNDGNLVNIFPGVLDIQGGGDGVRRLAARVRVLDQLGTVM